MTHEDLIELGFKDIYSHEKENVTHYIIKFERNYKSQKNVDTFTGSLNKNNGLFYFWCNGIFYSNKNDLSLQLLRLEVLFT